MDPHQIIDGGSETDPSNGTNNRAQTNKLQKKKKKKSGRKASYLPKFGCLRIEEDKHGNFDMEIETIGGDKPNPTHLVVMVNGIVGSAQNWKFAARQFLKKYPRDAIVHCSRANYNMLTFDGVDVMGERLAAEVTSVVERHPSVRKISFVSHSLGGLISRYAIAKLYTQTSTNGVAEGNGEYKSDESKDKSVEENLKNKIAGLEPVNFITFATPHLGSRWHKQVPLFCGSYKLEKAATRMSWCLGKTGKHLFLTDGKDGKPPLLLQMVSDSEGLKFMSALQSFKRRVAYANARFDNIVGWSTSSLRRRNELPKRRHLSRDEQYRHVCHLETSKISNHRQENSTESIVNGSKDIDIEEEMIRSLTNLSWERVDVKFNGFSQRLLGHTTIQVKTKCINSAGADVVQHMIDNFQL